MTPRLCDISVELEHKLVRTLNAVLKDIHKWFHSTPLGLGLCISIHTKLFDYWPTWDERAKYDLVLQLCQTYWKEWPEYSGQLQYPVPSPYPKRYSATKAFNNLSMRCGRYGAARKRLLEFLIECTEYHLESLQ